MTTSRPEDPTDSVDELVAAAKSDRIAFGLLFDHFYPPIVAYCVRRLLVRATAEDVASDVFLKVARGIRQFPGTTGRDFRRWLFRIATNEINAYLRQSIRRRELLEAAATMGLVDASIGTRLLGGDEATDWEAVYGALEKLSDREIRIVSLRFFAGMKHEEIAAVLGAKSGAVRVALSRALEKMRELLREPSGEFGSTATSSTRGNKS